MSAAIHADSAIFDRRREPGAAASAALAAAVHVVLALLLLFGVSWQNRTPAPVVVELWEPPPAPREAPPPAPVQAAPEPAPPPPVVRPEIVERAKPAPKPPPPKATPKPAPKVEAKVEAKAAPKAVAPRDDVLRKRMLEEAAREQLAFSAQRERERVKEMLARDAASATKGSLASWTEKVRAKVRQRIFVPPGITGNPEAIFEVTLLPTYEVLDVKLKKSSGHRALDDAIERAIRNASPLPAPDKPELFQRTFNLSYRPQDL